MYNTPLCIYNRLFTHSPIEKHLGCICLLAIVNNAARKMSLQISLQDLAFPIFGYPEVELLDHVSIFIFGIPRSVLHSGCTVGDHKS